MSKQFLTPLRLVTMGTVGVASDVHPFGIGPITGPNLAIDNNVVQARNNGVLTNLFLNYFGGDTYVDGSGTSALIVGSATQATLKLTSSDAVKLIATAGWLNIRAANQLYADADSHILRTANASVVMLNMDNSTGAKFGVPVRVPQTGDVALATEIHGFQVGPSNSHNLAFDYNKIQSRFQGMPNTLPINPLGGTVIIGDASYAQLDIGNTGSKSLINGTVDYLGLRNLTTIYYDSANHAFRSATFTSLLNLTGNGNYSAVPMFLPGAPTDPAHATTKQYVDSLAGQAVLDTRYVNVTGDTMTGPLYLGSTNAVSLSGTPDYFVLGAPSVYIDSDFTIFRKRDATAMASFQYNGLIVGDATGARIQLGQSTSPVHEIVNTPAATRITAPQLYLDTDSLVFRSATAAKVLGQLYDGGFIISQPTSIGSATEGLLTIGSVTIHGTDNYIVTGTINKETYMDGSTLWFRGAGYTSLLGMTTAQATFYVPVVLPANPTVPLGAATKQYVDLMNEVEVGATDPIATNPNAQIWYDTSV